MFCEGRVPHCLNLREYKMEKLKIQSIDHIVMQAADVAATVAFYTEIMGMEHSDFQPPTGGPVRQSLHFGNQKINLHNASSPYIPHAKTRSPAVSIFVSSPISRLATGSSILPIMALKLRTVRFVKPAPMGHFYRFISAILTTTSLRFQTISNGQNRLFSGHIQCGWLC